MKILITGATGFLGRALTLRLQRDGHAITAWARSPARARDLLGPDVTVVDGDGLAAAAATADAVINLAGEPILERRWTTRRRAQLIASRVDTTAAIGRALASRSRRLPVLISASAVGYYGDTGSREIDEHHGPGGDFAAALCQAWEAAAAALRPQVERLVVLRIGIVLGVEGGALAAMRPAFRAGVGGPIGAGTQWVPWVHLDDLLEIIVAALHDRRLDGAVNAVGPRPVTSHAFARTLGQLLGRPALLSAPAPLLRLALGERAGLLLGGQRARPRALEAIGFRFRFASLDAALADLLARPALEIRRVAAAEVPDTPYLRARPPTHVLIARTVIAAPLAEVAGFFSAAENLALITPPAMGFRIVSPRPIAMAAGAVIDYQVRVHGVPLAWRTVIERHQPGVAFVDAQHRGPYRSWWHEHRFSSSGSRTIMDDVVYFAAPLGPLGRLATRLLITAELRGIFGYRAIAIARRFGPAPSRAAA